MEYYLIKYEDGRIKSGYFWTDGEAQQFAKDMSKGYSFEIEVYEDLYESLCPSRLLWNE